MSGGLVSLVKKVLVWNAGNILQYEPVNYRFNSLTINTFLAPAALYAINNYDICICLVPSTLFTRDHVENYKLVLKAKAGYKNLQLIYRGKNQTKHDEYVCSLVDKIRGYLIPHGGIAKALDVTIQDDKVIVDEKHIQYNYDFNIMLNAIYSALCSEIEQVVREDNVEVHIDLTHGSNIMVLALMISSQILAESKGIEVKLYSAPILSRPQPNTQVDFIDITEASYITRKILSGISAWSKLDERLLPISEVRSVGRKLGPLFRETYSNVTSIAEKSRDILWYIRSGQIPLIHSKINNLDEHLMAAKNSLNKIINQIYINQENVLQIQSDRPWFPISDSIITQTSILLDKIRGEIPLETTIKTLKVCSSEVEYYDKVIGVLRELIILLIARRLYTNKIKTIEPGRNLWNELDNILTSIARKELDKVDKWFLEMLSEIGLAIDDLKIFDTLKKKRNMLMHGTLTKETRAIVDLETGKVVNVSPISRDELRRLCQEALNLVNKLL